MPGSGINIACLVFLSAYLFSCTKNDTGGVLPANNYTVYATEVYGLSGLCFGKDKSTLFAVSDKYGIYELNTNGSTKRKLPYSGSNDFEAITINPATGTIYLADEFEMNLLQLSADETTVSTVTHITVPGAISNKGIEGLAFGRDTLYAVNQQSPTILIKYSLAAHAETGRITLSFAQYLSDIFFDESDQSLWICDSYQQKIFHCNLNGDVIASQSVEFVAKPEALAVDRAANIAWVGCDQTGKLYRIKLTI